MRQIKSLLQRLGEQAVLFLKLGTIGFGGPAAHIAMMEEEVVQRRKWITRQHFLDLVGATNLIPGPNSTEMAIHIGYLRAGWLGLVTAGVCFILPAVLIVAAFAWAYVTFGSLPEVAPFLYGIKPAVIAVILGAVWRLGKTAMKGWRLIVVGIAVAVASVLGLNEVLALLSGGFIGMFWQGISGRGKRASDGRGATGLLCLNIGGAFKRAKSSAVAVAALTGSAAGASVSVSLWKLGLFFLKIGAVLYGSGYVLVAFLEGGLVRDYGWLTQQQLLDAVAIGQFTPGPVLSTATFIGYLVSGTPGALIATVSIFLPSFFFVAALGPVIPHLRRYRWSSAFLDAINISAVALMAAVTVKLGRATLTGWPAWLIALGASGAAIRWKVNPAWIVLGGAIVGALLSSWIT